MSFYTMLIDKIKIYSYNEFISKQYDFYFRYGTYKSIEGMVSVADMGIRKHPVFGHSQESV